MIKGQFEFLNGFILIWRITLACLIHKSGLKPTAIGIILTPGLSLGLRNRVLLKDFSPDNKICELFKLVSQEIQVSSALKHLSLHHLALLHNHLGL